MATAIITYPEDMQRLIKIRYDPCGEFGEVKFRRNIDYYNKKGVRKRQVKIII